MKKTAIKKPVFVILVIIFLAGISCTGESGKASGRTKLNFLEVMTSPGRTEVLKAMIAEYENNNPNVTINLISPPYEQADNRLAMNLQAQEPLDVIEVRDLTITGFVNNSWLTDLTPYFSIWDEYDTLLAVAKDVASVAGGKPYFLPQWFMIKALFLRTDVLAALGVTRYPSTLEELYAMAKRITNPVQNQYGFNIRGKGNPFKSSDPLIISDLPGVDTENIYKLKNGSSVFNDNEFLSGLRNYADLFRYSAPTDSINWGFNEQINAFVSGVTPILIQDPDTITLLDEHLKRDQYTVIPMPVGKSGTVYLDYGYAGYSIPVYSGNKDAAWEFIAWLSSYPQNSHFSRAYGALPIHTTSYTSDPYFSTGVFQAWQIEMNTPDKFTFVKYPYDSSKFAGWAQVQEQYMQLVLLGKATPEQAAKAWSEYWK